MINVDISNVWTCVTLPELLGSEKQIFDAHQLLRNNQPDGPDLFGWLGLPDSITGRLIHSINRRAQAICDQSDVLVVCGSGDSYNAARAAVSAYGGSHRNALSRPQVFFAGESLSGRNWLELQSLLADKDYSLHIISPTGKEPASNISARGLRWMMERKYGSEAKTRITVATPVGTPLHKMGQEEGFELFPMPVQLGGTCSGLNTAALLPMAVAGIDPLSVLEGAAESYKELDIRSFENPAWLYAAARTVLPTKGKDRELLCFFDHSFLEFGRWWQRYVWNHECRNGRGIRPETLLLPGDLETTDAMILADPAVFETHVHFDPVTKKIPVEMDWKDYDGLGFLSGKHLDFTEDCMRSATMESHNYAGVPVLDIHAGELSAQSLGELFYFFELSASLTAQTAGLEPFAPSEGLTVQSALKTMAEQP